MQPPHFQNDDEFDQWMEDRAYEIDSTPVEYTMLLVSLLEQYPEINRLPLYQQVNLLRKRHIELP